jgi:hypothetical protein
MHTAEWATRFDVKSASHALAWQLVLGDLD